LKIISISRKPGGHPHIASAIFKGGRGLYSGFVFDWEGNPVKRLNLKAGVVTSDDKTLYVNNSLTKSIEFSLID